MDDRLVVATVALVGATLVLAVVAALQLRQMIKTAGEATQQTEAFKEQADLLRESLSVSREMLGQATADREDAAPFSVAVTIGEESVAGNALIEFRNPGPEGVILRLRRVEVHEMPSDALVDAQDLAEGTLGVRADELWQFPFVYDPNRVGATYYVLATGRRLNGPVMTRQFAFRVGSDGRLADLSQPDPPEAFLVWG